jgi:hypothetical protein
MEASNGTDAAINDSSAPDAPGEEASPCYMGVCPTVLASAQAAPWSLAIDATSVYWQNLFDDTVNKVDLAGGMPKRVTYQPYISAEEGIAVDATNVYFMSSGDPSGVLKVPIGGGTAVDLTPSQVKAERLVIDTTTAYYCSSAEGTVKKVPLAGGQPVTLFARETTNDASPNALAVDATGIYVGFDAFLPSKQSISKISLAGDPPATLVAGVSAVDLVLDATDIYFADGQTLQKVPLAGGTPTVLARESAWRLALDATTIYWTDPFAKTIKKMPKSGGTPVTLAVNQVDPWSIAVDATHVYWANRGKATLDDPPDGTIMRVAK